MSKFKVVYADGSKDTESFEGSAEELFEQKFSHLSDETKALCSVKMLKAASNTPQAEGA